MSTVLHQTQPQVATQDNIHQTPDLYQRHIKHNLAILHFDLRYVFELTLRPQTLMQYLKFQQSLHSKTSTRCCWCWCFWVARSCFRRYFSMKPLMVFSFFTLSSHFSDFNYVVLLCFRCCGGMDCNCVSDLLLPPVPALWTPGQSQLMHISSGLFGASGLPKGTYFVKSTHACANILKHIPESAHVRSKIECNQTAKTSKFQL